MTTLMAAQIEHARSLPFKEGVWKIVETIPEGYVLGYGHIAALSGFPNRARQAGFALSKMPPNTSAPWWRVIRSDGSIPNHGAQNKNDAHALILKSENVSFKGSRVNMVVSKWNPTLL